MTKEEIEIYNTLFTNSIVFFRDTIDKLTTNDIEEDDYISHDLILLTCTSTQISLELALKVENPHILTPSLRGKLPPPF